MAVHARRVVTGYWDGSLPAQVPVLLTGTPEQFAAQLGETRVAAVTGVAAATILAGGTRIVVNLAEMDTLTPLGKQVVMTHEMVHVATGSAGAEAGSPASRGDGVPLWLTEGFTDYVAMTAHSVPLRDALASLAQPPGGATTAGLPEPHDFRGAYADDAYAMAFLACYRIARTHGRGALARLYRAGERTGVDAAMRAELGMSFETFRADTAEGAALMLASLRLTRLTSTAPPAGLTGTCAGSLLGRRARPVHVGWASTW